jgi:organic hydroperoxide reductase OsmC/OhrA
MSHYLATVRWQRNDGDFRARTYSREHLWEFDGGTVVPASASPQIVPLPMSNAVNVDPEEAFVASLSSCHMLFFLDLAARAGYQIDSYVDAAEGRMGKNAQGKTAMTEVTLHPVALFSGPEQPDSATIASLHHKAHELCFIANSVTTAVAIAL